MTTRVLVPTQMLYLRGRNANNICCLKDLSIDFVVTVRELLAVILADVTNSKT
jgi:hypothetical protein